MANPDRVTCLRPRDSSSHDPDALLYCAFLDGSEAAFRTLFERHKLVTARVAFNVLGDWGEAEDVTQDVFAGLWRKRAEWSDTGAKFSTWLYRIVLNRALDCRRRRQRRAVEAIDSEDAQVALRAEPDQERRCERDGEAAVLMRQLRHLPAAQRAALVQFYLEERSVAEIGSRLGISVQAVRALLKRGRRTLREGAFGDKAESDGYSRIRPRPRAVRP